MKYDIQDTDNERIYVIRNDLLSSSISQLENDLNEFISGNDRDIVLDLKNISKIDSVSIATIIRLKKRITEKGGTLSLINPNESVLRVLELSGLDSFLLE